MRTVILVHGFWHGSWCWSRVTSQLAARGVPSVAVDVDGHGLNSRSGVSRWGRPFDQAAFATERSGVAHVTASSAAVSLVSQIEEIGGGEPCVVVVHSMNGTVATAAAELAPALFGRLVYLAAFAPVTGSPALTDVFSPDNAGELVTGLLAADPAVVGALRIDTGDLSRHAAIRDAFYGDVDDATATAAIALIQPDAPAGVPAEALTVTAGRYGSVPHTYLVCRNDNAIKERLQRRLIGDIDSISKTPTTVVEFDSCHSPFLSQPADLAAAIAELC
jgi:pimeloyl-ACP methyl ester carboxylesterase